MTNQHNDLYANCEDREKVTIEEKGNGHYQIMYKNILINHYPNSKKRTAYLKGTTKGVKDVSPCRAIQLAINPDKVKCPKTQRKNNYLAIKKKMYQENQTCGICGEVIAEFSHATLDHIVPLMKGGLNARNNYQLAHEACNIDKGNKLISNQIYQTHSEHSG